MHTLSEQAEITQALYKIFKHLLFLEYIQMLLNLRQVNVVNRAFCVITSSYSYAVGC